MKVNSKSILVFIWALSLFCLWAKVADSCPACWSGYGPGAERFNKPLAELSNLYEIEGRGALPEIRRILKTTNDPMLQQRALEYIVILNDVESIPLLENLLLEVVKRVSFTSFGVTLDPGPFQTRLKVAHTLAAFGKISVADRIWKKYARLDLQRKSEIPYILNALGDPQLTKRVMEIIDRHEDHQLMVGALNVLAIGGSKDAVPFLQKKETEWKENKIEYSVLRIKAQQAIFKIKERT